MQFSGHVVQQVYWSAFDEHFYLALASLSSTKGRCFVGMSIVQVRLPKIFNAISLSSCGMVIIGLRPTGV